MGVINHGYTSVKSPFSTNARKVVSQDMKEACKMLSYMNLIRRNEKHTYNAEQSASYIYVNLNRAIPTMAVGSRPSCHFNFKYLPLDFKQVKRQQR